MKKITILFSILLFGLSASFAKTKKPNQQWIVVGARGTFNSTWLLNSNQMSDKRLGYQASFGGGGGLMVGFHATNLISINVEGLYSIYNQKLKSEVDSLPWSSKTSLAFIELPVLIHFDFENFKYLEVGVKYNMLQSASSAYTNTKYPLLDNTNTNMKSDYSNNLAVVFGWGGGIWGSGGLMISGGLRLTYGLTDIISTDGGRGNLYYTGSQTGGTANTKPYSPTNLATIGIHFSADFDLGWVVKSSCGRNHKFMMFSH